MADELKVRELRRCKFSAVGGMILLTDQLSSWKGLLPGLAAPPHRRRVHYEMAG